MFYRVTFMTCDTRGQKLQDFANCIRLSSTLCGFRRWRHGRSCGTTESISRLFLHILLNVPGHRRCDAVVLVVHEDRQRSASSSRSSLTRPASSRMRIKDTLITGSTDCTARCWSFDKGCTLHVFSGHTGPVTCLGIDAEAKVLITGSTDGSVRSWDIKAGSAVRVFESHTTPVVCMTVRPIFRVLHEFPFNPFNASCSKLLLFEGFSAMLV